MVSRNILAILTLIVLLGVTALLVFPCTASAQDGGPAPTATGDTASSPNTDSSHSSHHGDPSATVFGVLALIVSCAALGRFGAKKLKQSPVLGELAVGIIVGAVVYQLGGPTITIIRHYDLIEQAGDIAFSQGKSWEPTVRTALAEAGLSKDAEERVTQILLSKDFPAYLALARSIQLFASLGVIMLLFMVGLEVSLKELKASGGSASAIALLGVSGSFLLAYLATSLFLPADAGPTPCLFVGAALCASSIGITARIFKDMNALGMKEAKTVLGAAVLDDILGLIVLAVVVAVATSGTVEISQLLLILLKTALFLGGVVIFGTMFFKRSVRFLEKLDLGQVKLLYPFALLMALAWLADKIGLAGIIGAFAAGVIIKEESFDGIGPESNHGQTVESIMTPLEGILAPIFFVLIGLQVDVTTLASVKVLLMGLVLTAVAVAGKLLASLAAKGAGDRLIVGIGMFPRVEVALIVASMGKSLGVLHDALYSVIIMVVLLTVLMTPPLLKWAIEKKQKN